ncbi:MAG: dihydrofolate reductase, partial [Actinomycetota bacterium]|nr:dihydrofolate reductase [Actinomycetota bacterium]
MPVSLVAAVAANGVIGRDGDLPWPRTGDLAHFKALTIGHVLVMG